MDVLLAQLIASFGERDAGIGGPPIGADLGGSLRAVGAADRPHLRRGLHLREHRLDPRTHRRVVDRPIAHVPDDGVRVAGLVREGGTQKAEGFGGFGPREGERVGVGGPGDPDAHEESHKRGDPDDDHHYPARVAPAGECGHESSWNPIREEHNARSSYPFSARTTLAVVRVTRGSAARSAEVEPAEGQVSEAAALRSARESSSKPAY